MHRPLNNKMKKTLVLLNHPDVKNHVPVTEWFTEQRVISMIDTYPTLFIKPNKGRIGTGIVRLRKIDGPFYEVHYHNQAEKYETIEQALIAVKEKMIPGKRYLIQQGIELATVLDRPFDFRIIMHKMNGRWEKSAWCAKISPPWMIVTNHARGGIIISAEQALAVNKHLFDYKKALTELTDVCSKICAIFDDHFSFYTLGIDMAIDKNGHIWFIEANTMPDHAMFRKLGDPRIYRELIGKEREVLRKARNPLEN